MKLQTIEEVERGIGGRPSKDAQRKVRMSVYLSPQTAQAMQKRVDQLDLTTSQYIRGLIKQDVANTGK